jgi:hypothetical protein
MRVDHFIEERTRIGPRLEGVEDDGEIRVRGKALRPDGVELVRCTLEEIARGRADPRSDPRGCVGCDGRIDQPRTAVFSKQWSEAFNPIADPLYRRGERLLVQDETVLALIRAVERAELGLRDLRLGMLKGESMIPTVPGTEARRSRGVRNVEGAPEFLHSMALEHLSAADFQIQRRTPQADIDMRVSGLAPA